MSDTMLDKSDILSHMSFDLDFRIEVVRLRQRLALEEVRNQVQQALEMRQHASTMHVRCLAQKAKHRDRMSSTLFVLGSLPSPPYHERLLD